VLEWDRDNVEGSLEKVRSLDPDLFVVTSFGVILKQTWLDVPKIAPINLHASILPRYRGASPMQMAILNGDKQTGVSVMRMVPQCDAGDVMGFSKLDMDPHETTPTLEERLSRLAADVLMEALPKLQANTAVWVPQDEKLASHCSKIEKSQGQLDWKKSAERLDREIRAFRGWPGSYFFYQGKRIHVGSASLGDVAQNSTPGKILGVSSQEGLVVACGQSALRLQALQLEGRKMLPIAEFLRGFNLKAGDFLE
jgi:methionyl-tRNA formyltransferase